MIQLKPLIIDSTGWLEAAWVNVEQKPDKGEIESPVYCQSFHPTQIDLLRTKATEYETPLDEYEQMLADWVAAYTTPDSEPLTPEQLQTLVVQATQQRLDDFARTRNYDGILSACTYATSAVPKFCIEGQYAVQARDTTWAALYALLAEVQAGTRPAPASFDDVAPLLPVLEWPQ